MEPKPFCPVSWLPGPILQTAVPSFWPAPEPPGADVPQVVAVAEDAALRLDVNRPREAARGTVVLVHGLCGSSASTYMRRTAREAVLRSWVAVRMNLRTCGGTEALSTTLCNAGQSRDLERVLTFLGERAFPRPHVVVGFSMGGNIVLRYAGLSRDRCRAEAVVAVNPPVELERCVRRIEEPDNRLFHLHFVRKLRRQLRRLQREWRRGDMTAPFASIRDFDARFTAPDAGYASAEAYYADASAYPHLGGIGRATLVLSARNDPIIPAEMFERNGARNPRLTYLHPERGGHCGYWHSGTPRYWAAGVTLDFLESAVAAGRFST